MRSSVELEGFAAPWLTWVSRPHTGHLYLHISLSVVPRWWKQGRAEPLVLGSVRASPFGVVVRNPREVMPNSTGSCVQSMKQPADRRIMVTLKRGSNAGSGHGLSSWTSESFLCRCREPVALLLGSPQACLCNALGSEALCGWLGELVGSPL